MTFLQRVLKLQATFWAVAGAALAAIPGWVVRDVLGQRTTDADPWLRSMGVMSIALAMLMVLVGHHTRESWWWAWSFAVLEAGTATVFVLTGAFSLPTSTAAWPWWALGAVHATFGALDLLGIGAAGREKPIVP